MVNHNYFRVGGVAVDLPYGWLGNMYASPVRYNGEIWKTSEALFQALRFEDLEIRALIRNEKSPMGAKMKAKKFKEKPTAKKWVDFQDIYYVDKDTFKAQVF
jgi:predicted NAD-dependent protein-ADP-ribosyltransferase YbiA (DUF1768 family)